MKFPKGSKFYPWSITSETQKGVRRTIVRRTVLLPNGDKTLKRLPTKEYKHIRDNPEELRKFVIRLNERVAPEERAKAKIEFRHAFIDPKLLEDYKDFLLTQIPTRDRALTQYYYLTKYFLDFFINTLQINDPFEWHRVHDTEWAKFLLSDETPAASATKKEIVAAANRFMKWLHKRRPSEVPPLHFQPLSTAMYKKVEADRELRGEVEHRRAIDDKDWEIIEAHLPENIRPFVLLARNYGLREAETLGVQLEDVKQAYLSVERQLIAIDRKTRETDYGPLKGREPNRKVPHDWFSTANETYDLIEEIYTKTLLIHPDTLGDRWRKLMTDLKLDYTFHELKHTYTTKSLSKRNNPRDVQLAVGHKNITTTMRYSHDDRKLDDEIFVPTLKKPDRVPSIVPDPQKPGIFINRNEKMRPMFVKTRSTKKPDQVLSKPSPLTHNRLSPKIEKVRHTHEPIGEEGSLVYPLEGFLEFLHLYKKDKVKFTANLLEDYRNFVAHGKDRMTGLFKEPSFQSHLRSG